MCGWALARAHARSGDAAMIAGYMGSGSIFDEAICDFAVDYADQAEQDHKAFVKAVREGRVKRASWNPRPPVAPAGGAAGAIVEYPWMCLPGKHMFSH